MRASLEVEFGKDSESSEAEEGGGEEDSNYPSSAAAQPADELFCPACNKLFKSSKA